MTRAEYMRELELRLVRLPKEEKADALSYYSEYLDEAGIIYDSDEVPESMGKPGDVAAQIIKDCATKAVSEPPSSVKKGFSSVWIAILALLAAPIGIPLLLTGLAIIITIALLVFSLLLAVFSIGLAVLVLGVTTIGLCVKAFAMSIPFGLVILGAGLAILGLGLMGSIALMYLAKGCFYLIKKCFYSILRFVVNKFNK